jgi:DNA-binding response OmpR family regulator
MENNNPKEAPFRALVLEDSQDRVEEFKKRFKEKGWEGIYVDNVTDFEKKLLTEKYDIIFLDHDLEGQAYVNSEYYNTGATAAKMIVKRRSETKIKFPIIIHSANPHGADSMFDTLRDSGAHAVKVSFVWLPKEFRAIFG